MSSHENFIKWCKSNNVKRSKDLNSFDRPPNITFIPSNVYDDFDWTGITGDRPMLMNNVKTNTNVFSRNI